VAVLNADELYFSKWREIAGQRTVISFAIEKTADVMAKEIMTQFDRQQFITQFQLLTGGHSVPVKLALAGKHNVLNALAASATCLALGVSVEQIQTGLQRVKAVNGRLQSVATNTGFQIINDTYNANPASLTAALEVLKSCTGELWLALGAFGELGADSASLHRAMAEEIKTAGVTRLFAVGEMAKNTVQAFGAGAVYYHLQEDLIAALKKAISKDVVLLVKGSRAQKMEAVVEALIGEAR